jgi:ABC-2 type transport system ATP-binding protein
MGDAACAAILEARRLTKRYGGLPAVSDVSFAIRPGDVLGYLGPNGSGKSTTVKMLTGLLAPTTGQILYRGRDINEDLVDYKRQVGYAPEEANLYTFLTGAEYLELVGTLRELPSARLKEKVESLLHDFSMYPHRHSPISSYSKGMRQRIMLIAALMHDPELLILDEPFSGLDVTMALTFRQVIKLLAASGKAIFFCSPVLEVVEKVCSHLVLLKKGEVAAYGAIDEIREKGLAPALEDAFLQLTEHFDADARAANIVAAVHAPVC